MSRLVLDRITKVYSGGVVAVADVSLAVEEGELLVLLGPSGCGKSTILRMVAGLEDVTSGTIELDGRILNDVAERERDIAMVFQSYALYPHMTVAQNIAYPLRQRRVRREVRRQRVTAVAQMLELHEVLQKKPAQLSGGQRQRVAMGRAMVREPRLFLLDEPLSNLDAALRVQMRTEIHALQRRLGVGMVFVTHDQTEAMTLGDRVAVLRHGLLQQIGPPDDVYRRPVNSFVAAFMGSPGMTLLEADVVPGDPLALDLAGQRVLVDPLELRQQPGLARRTGTRVVAGLRAEELALADTNGGDRRISATLRFQEQLGSSLIAYFAVEGITRRGAVDESLERRLSDDAGAGGRVEPPHLLPARLPSSTRLVEGSTVELAVQPGALRFFDPESGQAV